MKGSVWTGMALNQGVHWGDGLVFARAHCPQCNLDNQQGKKGQGKAMSQVADWQEPWMQPHLAAVRWNHPSNMSLEGWKGYFTVYGLGG
jgi:hypothetical protein